MGTYLAILGGLALLAGGSDILVRGAVSLAQILRVSPFLIGFTLVAWGTSTPELVTGITAALTGSAGIAVGNVVGTNIANILLILGLAAALRPFAIDREEFRRDSVMILATSIALLACVLYGSIGRLVGSAMMVALIAYSVFVYKSEKAATAKRDAERSLRRRLTYPVPRRRPPPSAVSLSTDGGTADPNAPGSRPGMRRIVGSLLLCAGGLAAVIGGAYLLVDGAIALGRLLSISETVIGLTVVAVGTSAPEFVMAVIAGWRGQPALAYANIIGSHLYNTLFVLGASALTRPLAIPAQIAAFDIWVMLAATALLVFFGRSGFRLTRWEGVALVAAYAAYIWRLVSLP